MRRLTDEYSKYEQSCELIQQVESSVTLQLQMNEQAISHLNEQIEKKHQKGSYILYDYRMCNTTKKCNILHVFVMRLWMRNTSHFGKHYF